MTCKTEKIKHIHIQKYMKSNADTGKYIIIHIKYNKIAKVKPNMIENI